MIGMIREVSDIPCAVGFGISTSEQAGRMAALSDGAIVGSAIVKLIAQYGRDSVGPVTDYVRSMKKGIEDAASINAASPV
jgi:tryptophan synthase alpha chain